MNIKEDSTNKILTIQKNASKTKRPNIDFNNNLFTGLAYKYKCGGCNAIYYGKTKRHFKVRICEHLGISHLTEKKIKIDNNKLTAIQEHLLCYNYSPSFEDFPILTREVMILNLK